MLKSKPKFSYCGLTIVLSHPSRFDNKELLSANGGIFFNEMCLRPDYNKYQCEIRLAEDRSPLLPNTKCVLLLGLKAMEDWLGDLARDNTLGELRGSPFIINNICHIASYFPQDCVDLKDYESEYLGELSDDDNDDDETDDKRRHGRTKRRNFGFWLMKDCEKVKKVLKNNGVVEPEPQPEYVIYPPANDVIEELLNAKGKHLYIDIETDSNLNILCFAYAFSRRRIVVVPITLPDYSHSYSSVSSIFAALAIACKNNTLVAHNGSNFDFHLLVNKYHIPVYSLYDTLIAQHRCFPEQEKSLGHCTSLWTWQKFHKDLGNVGYNSLDNARQTWQYCGIDVFTMILIHEAIEKYATRMPGLKASIDAGMAAIRPYLITSILGIRYDDIKLKKILAENDRLMTHYIKWIEYLVGENNIKEIRGKGKGSMAASNHQCVKYFHDMLGYDVVGKGQERKDGTRGPSLGKKNMFKLRLKYPDNPVIDIILAYRELAKESGALSFTPWATKIQAENVIQA